MLTRSVLGKADHWWARDFGCSPAKLRPAEPHVQAHRAEMLGNEGIWILVAGEFPVISVPPRLLPALQERASGWTRERVKDPSWLERDLQPFRVERAVSPAFIGYATAETLVRNSSPRARPLTLADSTAVDE